MFRNLLLLAFLIYGSFGYLLSPSGHFSHHETGPDKCIQCKSDYGRYDCDREEYCRDGEVCFRQEYSKDGQTFYHAGCTDMRHCDSMRTSSYHWEFSHEHLKDGVCCSTTNCNTQSILTLFKLTTSAKPLTTTSKEPTTTTIVRKTTAALTVTAGTDAITTTTPGTTSSSTFSTPTTTYPTTTNLPIKGLTSTSSTVATLKNISSSAPTNTSQNGNTCLVCSDEKCKYHISYQCPESYPLCLTSVNNEDGDASFDKRCASFSECAERWLIESSLKPECTSLGKNSTFGTGLNCTFCCDADSCNKEMVPPAETLVYKF